MRQLKITKGIIPPAGKRRQPNAFTGSGKGDGKGGLIPQFPGQQNGASIEQVRSFNKNMVRRKGFRLSGGTTSQAFEIKISGTAKFLLGIVFLNQTFGVCSLTINNEVVFTDMDTGFFEFGETEQDYYAVNRPLSGQDDITLTITGDNNYNNEPFAVYYL